MNAVRNHAKKLSWTLGLAFLLPVPMAHAGAPRRGARTHARVRAVAIPAAVGNFGSVGYNPYWGYDPYAYGYSDYGLGNVVTTPMTNLLTPIATTPMTNFLTPYPSSLVSGTLLMTPY
jgi:hypothetical protein